MVSRLAEVTKDGLAHTIDGMKGARVVLAVDLVADVYQSGRSTRISREAPVLILERIEEQVVPGGGANAVCNVAALGGEPLPVGWVGDDDAGAQLLEELTALSIDCGGIESRADYQTPTKTRILGGSSGTLRQQIVRLDRGGPRTPSARDLEGLATRIEERAAATDVIVFSDYGYGAVDPELIRRVRNGQRCIVDSRRRIADFAGAYCATPNREEAEIACGSTLSTRQDVAGAAEAIRRGLGAESILLTRGSKGMALLAPHGVQFLPVFGDDQVADVTGAGDTVIAAFALALAGGASPLEASLVANMAGGLVVMKAGTATVSRRELHQALLGADEYIEALWEESSH